mgnify:CR=1 FL=1
MEKDVRMLLLEMANCRQTVSKEEEEEEEEQQRKGEEGGYGEEAEEGICISWRYGWHICRESVKKKSFVGFALYSVFVLFLVFFASTLKRFLERGRKVIWSCFALVWSRCLNLYIGSYGPNVSLLRLGLWYECLSASVSMLAHSG